MDRQLAERMVGAACLLAVLVLVVPAILDGNPDSGATITHPTVDDSLDLRTHTIRLDGAERDPPVPMPRQLASSPQPPTEPVPVPVPVPSGARPAAPAVRAVESPVPVPTTPKAGAIAATEPVPRSAPDQPAGSGAWIVQLGSFSLRENADRLAADLERAGFNASVKGGGGSSGTLFRVRAGPVSDRVAADALTSRLAAAGFKGGRVGRD